MSKINTNLVINTQYNNNQENKLTSSLLKKYNVTVIPPLKQPLYIKIINIAKDIFAIILWPIDKLGKIVFTVCLRPIILPQRRSCVMSKESEAILNMGTKIPLTSDGV